MKKILSFITAVVLSVSGFQPALGQDAYIDEQTPIPDTGALFLIGEEGGEQLYSTLGGFLEAGNNQNASSFACNSARDPDCLDVPMDGKAILPPCMSERQENCVVSLEVSRGGASFETASFTRLVKTKTFDSVRSLNFIEASAVSLWQTPASTGSNDSLGFAVSVAVRQSQEFPSGKFEAQSFVASVKPYREVFGPTFIAPYQFTVEGDPVSGQRDRSFAGGGHSPGCAWNEDGACGVLQDFEEDVKLRLTVRLPSQIGGWFRGRIQDPTFSVTRFSASNNEVVVSAQPVKVPRFAHVVSNVRDLTSQERALVTGFAGSWDRFTTWANAGEASGFTFAKFFRGKVKDTASGYNTFWNFASSNFANRGSPCLADTSTVLGIVTTNAMVYDGGVPSFSDGFLGYRVAGLHYQPDGQTLNLGTYDLVMRSETARCLYGFTKAPVSATVSVIGEDGSENIATTVVSERDGWLKLAAYGFTFSEKEIQVKISQPFQRTLTDHVGGSTALSTKQRAEIRAAVTRGAGNSKFICTGIRLEGQPMSMNRVVRLRAKLACDYAKSLNPELSTFFQTKTTKARSFNGRVLVVSK